MIMLKDYCQYADVFYGNGEVDHYAKDGLASKWFYIKALCGNTAPHACLPFGKMSAGAYSGGYPTGYGTHFPNSCGGIRKLGDEMTIRGFAHLHQSGVGAIGFYYNYAVACPFYGDLDQMEVYHPLQDEKGKPGYYAAQFNDILGEMTVNAHTALHRYHFLKENGRLAVDFSNDGLQKVFDERYFGLVKDGHLESVSENQVTFSGIFSGIKLYFCVEMLAENVKSSLFADGKQLIDRQADIQNPEQKFGVVFDFDGNDALLKVSYSTLSINQAQKQLAETKADFDQTADEAYRIWYEYLGAVEFETEDAELKKKFYSNLYHSIVKPTDMAGENVLGVNDAVTGFATLWDQYKTVFPLMFMLYPRMGEKIVKGLGGVSEALKKIPCSFDLSDKFPCEQQAKMLGIMSLCNAWHCGIEGADKELIARCIRQELSREDFASFLKDGVFERYTHILDTTDGCLAAAEILEDGELKDQLLALAKNWVKAYGEDGVMSENSRYYEGDRFTYSFRLQHNMEERIALAGGKEKFVQMLDRFFGFGLESIEQITAMNSGREIDEVLHKYHRFEGFNNECDMETPYAYIFAGRQDRTCEIVHESIEKSFALGKGALPGNNDSGGLSSCFVWNALGIFPHVVKGEFLMGSPHMEKATLHLPAGKTLEIQAKNLSKENFLVKSVSFNGKPVENFRIKAENLLQGGILEFEMMGK